MCLYFSVYIFFMLNSFVINSKSAYRYAKCLLAMMMLMLVIMMLILMLPYLNTSYADADTDLCIRIMSLYCINYIFNRTTLLQ